MIENMKVLYLCPYGFSKKLGAEQQDILATIQLIKSIGTSSVHWLSLNLQSGVIFDHNKGELITTKKLKFKHVPKFLKYKIFVIDRSMNKPFRLSSFIALKTFIDSNKIDLIITNTNSTVIYGLALKIKHIFRSLNYEPLHVLGEVENRLKAWILFLIKLFSVRFELNANIIWAISPRDLELYNKRLGYSSKKIQLFPLTQLSMSRSVEKKAVAMVSLNIGFLGASYNILHNRRSLTQLLECFCDYSNNFHFSLNIYGQKVELVKKKIQNNIFYNGWVENLSEIYEKNDIFVVPFVGGAGMQSKVFEPLTKGKILICDPLLLAGFDFSPNVHYLPAKNCQEIVFQLNWILNNREISSKISENVLNQSFNIFNENEFKDTVIKSFTALT